MGDDYEPYQWQVGDPEDWGDSVGVPDIPYMGYIDGDDEDDDRRPPRKTRGQTLRDEAWKLRNLGMYRDALDTINEALSEDGANANSYNMKAIILEDMGEYEDALRNYDRSLSMNSSQIVKDNKARLLKTMATRERYGTGNLAKALNLINDALKFTADESDRKEFLWIKGYILEEMRRWLDAKICFLLASEMYDELNKLERQAELIKSSKDTIICVTGTKFYEEPPLTEGTVVSLVREPDNEHDGDAIRVEIDGKTRGYVANSPETLIDGAKSASEIKDMIKDNQKAEMMFVFLDRYRLAKLI